ncbi:alginate lyase family protein [Caulobacter sp. 602-1]|uniref:alginate lyase family protein n=1 Tax=Caulobacter sp. 602-1 TaxID=2492472 RepID=UPI000F62F8F7|nr:alginate lyase family protein [Caulobacter sp. 602-1]RRN66208.1 alginate lyase [Caulobacter sp. 602-1]
MNRRDFFLGTGLALAAFGGATAAPLDIAGIDRARILKAADRYLAEAPATITAFAAPRGPGGRHDYYSEADYWWPDPVHPKGPYIRRDGYSNPDKFTAHRDAVIRLGVQLPALAAAYKVTRDARYAEHAEKHLRAWFVAPDTRMNPNLEHAQAIIGVNTGRGIGVIDTLHLVEVARAVSVLAAARPELGVYAPTIAWFDAYLTWLTTSPNGVDERDQKNNHGSCWALQAAVFAQLTGREAELDTARGRIKALVVGQIAADGSQPLELSRTKPYGYCLFNLDVLAACAHVMSTPSDSLWTFKGETGGSIADALAYMAPFIADKTTWPKPPDVEAWDGWPVRQPSLLFGGLALKRQGYLDLWKRLDPDPTEPEVIRNYPLRQPVLWVDA